MLSRRELIGKAAVGAALAVSAAGTGVAAARALHAATDDRTGGPADDRDGRNAVPPPAVPPPAVPPPADSMAISSPPPWNLLSPLVAGSVVAPRQRLLDLAPAHDGP